MACGMLAMLKAGIQVDNYYAYEIDKYAIKTAKHNFPQIEECGDVFNADFTIYTDIDFLIGGSPCTYWSIAQSPDKRETTASGIGWELFSQYVRALKEAKPKYFVYENNKSMARNIYDSISETFGFEPICINSALVSAQNRQRLYWVGRRNEDGTYSKVDVKQPEDKGILLKDVLEDSDLTCNDKSYTLTALYNGAVPWNTIERSQRNMVCEPVIFNSPHGYNKGSTVTDKAPTLTSSSYQENHKVIEPVACRCRGRKDTNGNSYAKYECREDGKANTLDTNTVNGAMVAVPINTTTDGKSQCLRATYYKDGIRNIAGNNSDRKTGVAEPVKCFTLPRKDGVQTQSKQYRVYDIDGKSTTLCAEGGGMGAKTGLYAIPVEFINNIPIKAISVVDDKTYKVYEVKDGQITIKNKTYPIKLVDGFYIIRKLTVNECKRLQTIPELYEFPVSNTQAYKMLGNGWTVDVIAHIFNSMV